MVELKSQCSFFQLLIT